MMDNDPSTPGNGSPLRAHGATAAVIRILPLGQADTADGRHLLMRHYAPERPAGRAEPDPATVFDPEESIGVTAVVRDLASGRDTTFGNVADAAWQTKGRLLAIAIAAEDRAGNGVQVFDPSSGTLRVLVAGPAIRHARSYVGRPLGERQVAPSEPTGGSHVACSSPKAGTRPDGSRRAAA